MSCVPLAGGEDTPGILHAPVGEPTGGAVVYLHGIQSHPGWFAGSAMAMADAGFHVHQVTRRGSGLSEAPRGHADSPAQLLEDVSAAVRFCRQRTGAARMHLVGVSWGGKLAACYAADGANEPIDSLTLIAPGIAARVDVRFRTKLAVAASLVADARTPRFEIPLSEPDLFTGNPAMREYLRADPLRLHKASAGFLYASRRLDWMLSHAAEGCIDAPTCLILSSRDRIIDNARTREVVGGLTANRAEVIKLAGEHTQDFEPDPRPFHEALVDWLRRADGLQDGRV